MKKLLFILVIIISLFCLCGCNNNSDEKIPISLNSIDISSLSNEDILNIINDDNLEEGLYKISTKNNDYIFFNGLEVEYENINLNLENKVLTISYDVSYNDSKSKKLYVLTQRNMTSSGDKSILFDKITLISNNKETSFKSIHVIK